MLLCSFVPEVRCQWRIVKVVREGGVKETMVSQRGINARVFDTSVVDLLGECRNYIKIFYLFSRGVDLSRKVMSETVSLR
jgi:hypothetical protein